MLLGLSRSNINLNAAKITFDPQEEIHQVWDKSQNGLTTTGQVGIAAAAAAVAIGTGGIGAGISGAMMTAAATTAATTATVSATNAGLNADSSNPFKIAEDSGKTAIKDTTSKESVKNMAIAAAVAGAASWAVEASGGTTSLEKGKDYAVYKPSDKLISDYPGQFKNYNGVIDPSVNNIGKANITDKLYEVGQPVPPYSTNPLTGSFWEGFAKESGFISNNANKVAGMNSMSLSHDPWANTAAIKAIPGATQLTIPPAIAIQYCATFPGACGAATSGLMNNEFGTKK